MCINQQAGRPAHTANSVSGSNFVLIFTKENVIFLPVIIKTKMEKREEIMLKLIKEKRLTKHLCH